MSRIAVRLGGKLFYVILRHLMTGRAMYVVLIVIVYYCRYS